MTKPPESTTPRFTNLYNIRNFQNIYCTKMISSHSASPFFYPLCKKSSDRYSLYEITDIVCNIVQ